jgi:pimeloyl-ACP methyl ester carboxylesterase
VSRVTVARSGEKLVWANRVELCLETFGPPAEPALLLMAGATSSMDWWEDGLCARIAAGPRFVIRYDQRDTGRSVGYEPGSPEYTGADLIGDALGIIDALGVKTAHVVGTSMGGGLAQWLAFAHPERVASLTLVSTSPGSGDDLPPMSEELRATFESPRPDPDWSDREAVVEDAVEAWRPYAGSRPLDERRIREISGRAFDRSLNIESSVKNHWLIESGGDAPGRAGLGEIEAPTLVVHGTDDPFFPLGHGEALAREIPDARLLAVEGMGHGYPPEWAWDVFVPALLEHTARS